MNISSAKQEMDNSRHKGYLLYETGHFKQAADLFCRLVQKSPFEVNLWFALASSYQMNKEYHQAIKSWKMAALLQPKDPFCYFHAAECYFSLYKCDAAFEALKEAKKRGKELSLLDKINALESQWKDYVC